MSSRAGQQHYKCLGCERQSEARTAFVTHAMNTRRCQNQSVGSKLAVASWSEVDTICKPSRRWVSFAREQGLQRVVRVTMIAQMMS